MFLIDKYLITEDLLFAQVIVKMRAKRAANIDVPNRHYQHIISLTFTLIIMFDKKRGKICNFGSFLVLDKGQHLSNPHMASTF